MVDAESVADNVPALPDHDAHHEPHDEDQCEDPAGGSVGRPFVQVVLVQPTDTCAYSLDKARLCYRLIGLQHILHHSGCCAR